MLALTSNISFYRKYKTITQCCVNVGHHLRRWPNIKTILGQCLMFLGAYHSPESFSRTMLTADLSTVTGECSVRPSTLSQRWGVASNSPISVSILARRVDLEVMWRRVLMSGDRGDSFSRVCCHVMSRAIDPPSARRSPEL